ncbi:MAG: NAD(P)/FAD-dependent oxidoreductase [Clostridium sp.]|jgi:predicted flavoprotein YhiN|nr:NAD(P)/FAD-dependent oxidoreductase [Clostridium sp.]
MNNIVVIGAGAAGMMAAITAAKHGASVTILEQNEKLGKKLFITGKGRCNATNVGNDENCYDRTDHLFENTVNNPKFLHAAYAALRPRDMIDTLTNAGCPMKIERGGRVFPCSDHASDVIAALRSELTTHNVRVLFHQKVTHILSRRKEAFFDDASTNNASTVISSPDKVLFDNALTDVYAVKLADGTVIKADAVVLATGGLSYRTTGSDGSGHQIAQALGHKIIEPLPALVPFYSKEAWCQKLQGLSLKNVSLRLFSSRKPSKTIYQGFGEMLFTHFGISGPLVLSASSYYQAYKRLADTAERFFISIDLKPALDADTLDKRLTREFDQANNKVFKNSLDSLFPAKLVPIMVDLSEIPPMTKANEITKASRKAFGTLIKDLSLEIIDTGDFSEAIITSGGVSVKDINPKTMGSKRVANLYFAGEIIDVDALTGGYNLQIAWSTGYLAGLSAATHPHEADKRGNSEGYK